MHTCLICKADSYIRRHLQSILTASAFAKCCGFERTNVEVDCGCRQWQLRKYICRLRIIVVTSGCVALLLLLAYGTVICLVSILTFALLATLTRMGHLPGVFETINGYFGGFGFSAVFVIDVRLVQHDIS